MSIYIYNIKIGALLLWRKILNIFNYKYKLKIKTLSADYVELSEVLLHANFQILVDFVDREPWGEKMWEPEIKTEMIRLYDWWTRKRPRRFIPPAPECNYYKLLFDEEYALNHAEEEQQWANWCEHSLELDIQFLKEDQENLEALINIREYLISD